MGKQHLKPRTYLQKKNINLLSFQMLPVQRWEIIKNDRNPCKACRGLQEGRGPTYLCFCWFANYYLLRIMNDRIMIESQKDMTEEERKKLEKAEWDEIWESVEKYSPMFQSKPTQEPKKDASKALEQLDITEQEKEKKELSEEVGEMLEGMLEHTWLFRSKPKQATDALEPSDMTQEKNSKNAPTMDKTTNVWDINGEKIPVTIRRIRCGYASKMKYDLPEPLKKEPEAKEK